MNETSASRSCGLATWSLVLGIFALVLCPIGLLFAIPAVICGHKALGRIKISGGTLQGGGLAITGLVMGYVAVAMSMVIGLLSIIAIPNFVKARNTAASNACVNNLRNIDSAKQQWALENAKKEDAVPTEGDLLPYVGRDGVMPVCTAGGTYEIRSVGESPTCSEPGHELSH
jgi:hypothetical protein